MISERVVKTETTTTRARGKNSPGSLTTTIREEIIIKGESISPNEKDGRGQKKKTHQGK